MFRTLEFTFWKMTIYYTDACKTHYKIPVYTTVFLMMNLLFPNMQKPP